MLLKIITANIFSAPKTGYFWKGEFIHFAIWTQAVMEKGACALFATLHGNSLKFSFLYANEVHLKWLYVFSSWRQKKNGCICVTANAYEAASFGIVFLYLYIAPLYTLGVLTDIKFVQQI